MGSTGTGNLLGGGRGGGLVRLPELDFELVAAELPRFPLEHARNECAVVAGRDENLLKLSAADLEV